MRLPVSLPHVHWPAPAATATVDRAARRTHVLVARVALFVVYFWFGILKTFGASPANALVANLLEHTLPFVPFDSFIVALGLYEMLVGALFLLPRCERVAMWLIVPHLFATVLPLALLPDIAWSGPWTPTLEGQYIIKNAVIVALAMTIVSQTSSRAPATSRAR